MEFNEKLQELRKKSGMTQEELAQRLYVSRAAVSKWESGRGYPNIDSLKEIAKCFSVSIDALLSGDEVLTIAEEEQKQKESRVRDLVFGLLDVSNVMFFLLPFFGQGGKEHIETVPLLSLAGIASWLKAAYFVIMISMIVCGFLTLVLQNRTETGWLRSKVKLSLTINACAVLLFIISRQPYAAGFLFIFLMIKVLMLVKWP